MSEAAGNKEIVKLPGVLIVGAGPAGLAVAGSLMKKRIPSLIIEKGSEVGFSWRNHYDRLHLHTVKEHSNLPYLRFPSDYPRYLSRIQFLEYLHNYASIHHIFPNLNESVEKIKKHEDGWLTKTNLNTYFSKNVVLAAGYNRIPNVPYIDGEDDFKGEIIHSHSYRNSSHFSGEQVLVIGIGNTGGELALDLCENGVETIISVRSPVNIIPREIFGRPSQLTGILLNKLPVKLADYLSNLVQRIVVGDLRKYGLETSQLSPSRQIEQKGRIPLIDIGTLKMIKKGKIKIVPAVERLKENTVLFKDGSEYNIDSIILATGYKAGVEDFFEDASTYLNERGYPMKLWFDSSPGLYFAGYENPSTGVLRAVKKEAIEIAKHINMRIDTKVG